MSKSLIACPESIEWDNFYKILKKHYNLDFIYKETASVYSNTGTPGIDPVVFSTKGRQVSRTDIA